MQEFVCNYHCPHQLSFLISCRLSNRSVKSATTIITNEEEISLQTIMNDTIAFVVQGEGKDPMLREPAESEWTVDRYLVGWWLLVVACCYGGGADVCCIIVIITSGKASPRRCKLIIMPTLRRCSTLLNSLWIRRSLS